MPTLAKVLTEDDLSARARTSHLDLSAYRDIIEQVRSEGVGGTITLDEDESQRAEKRRLSIAAKELGQKLTWRKSQPGELRFVLSEPGGSVPGGRPRRAKAQEQEKPNKGRRGTRR